MYKVEFYIKRGDGGSTLKHEYCQVNCANFAKEQYYTRKFNAFVNSDFIAWAPGVASLSPHLADFRRKLLNISNGGIVKASNYKALADVLGVKKHALASNIRRMKEAATVDTAVFQYKTFRGVYLKL